MAINTQKLFFADDKFNARYFLFVGFYLSRSWHFLTFFLSLVFDKQEISIHHKLASFRVTSSPQAIPTISQSLKQPTRKYFWTTQKSSLAMHDFWYLRKKVFKIGNQYPYFCNSLRHDARNKQSDWEMPPVRSLYEQAKPTARKTELSNYGISYLLNELNKLRLVLPTP